MSKDEMIRAKNIIKRYGKTIAVDGISFSISKGECYGLLGPNGAGKTTTIKIINCLSPINSGEMYVCGMDVEIFPRKAKALMGVVPQDENLDPDLTVVKNLLVYARYFEISKKEARNRAEELLKFLNLYEKKDSLIKELSGGMKKRLLIARALVNNPEILILDEPTTGLDPQLRHMIWQKLRLLKKNGITILMTTHYMEEASQLCNQVAIMDKGKILIEGNPLKLVEKQIGKEVIELRIDRDKEAELLKNLNDFDFAHERVGDTLYLFSRDGQDLVKFLISHDYSHLLHRPSTLEDLFLKLTGRGLKE